MTISHRRNVEEGVFSAIDDGVVGNFEDGVSSSIDNNATKEAETAVLAATNQAEQQQQQQQQTTTASLNAESERSFCFIVDIAFSFIFLP